jgi:hypothetical protein
MPETPFGGVPHFSGKSVRLARFNSRILVRWTTNVGIGNEEALRQKPLGNADRLRLFEARNVSSTL